MAENEVVNQVESEVEPEFNTNELFVSKTDKRGVIEYGNKVFVRVSSYAKDELIGAPHKIIRHRDMPRSVFKLFWSKVQANEPIIAYVKNRTKDGLPYWVLATAFPTQDGYLSIRLKPVTPLKDAAFQLYKQVLLVENEKGMDEGIQFILEQLKTLGFESYEEFMIHALFLELKNRDYTIMQKIKASTVTVNPQFSAYSNIFNEMKIVAMQAVVRYAQAVVPLGDLLKSKSVLEDCSFKIAQVCERLEFLSVNMSISAHKLGKMGGTLSIVASFFQNTAQKIVRDFDKFQENSKEISSQLQSYFLNLGCATVQSRMLSFSLDEIVQELANPDLTIQDIEEFMKQTDELVASVEEYFSSQLSNLSGFFIVINTSHRNLLQLRDFVTQLDLIKTGGKLEGSRSHEIVENFDPFIVEMMEFIEGVQVPAKEILTLIQKLEKSFENILSASNQFQHGLDELKILQGDLNRLHQFHINQQKLLSSVDQMDEVA